MNKMDRSEAIRKTAALIQGIKIAMLTTHSGQRLHSRPMATQQADFKGDLWFLSRAESGEVDEIEHGAMVNLTYVNSDSHAYVSLSGRAELTRDRAKIEELWKPTHYAWFPLGKDDPEIMVIKVIVEEAEYWEAPGNVLVRSYQLLKAVV
ncbi:MAG TPA: pyridoxamine 5'-phosphate oxidase family protein, partial [Acidobacteriaceae bacterium]|nr:pyridoxamine 5'-phosphate oxidase family protein [Acidobacteriaceae bacterium]